jgi:hypothetical protein
MGQILPPVMQRRELGPSRWSKGLLKEMGSPPASRWSLRILGECRQVVPAFLQLFDAVTTSSPRSTGMTRLRRSCPARRERAKSRHALQVALLGG